MASITLTYAPAGSGPCAKQTVKATLVAVDGSRYIGTNHTMSPQPSCARGEMPSGVGYDLCKSVCRQEGHAEVNAMNLAGSAAVGAVIYVEGHTYACDSCRESALYAGVARVIIGAPPEENSGDTDA